MLAVSSSSSVATLSMATRNLSRTCKDDRMEEEFERNERNQKPPYSTIQLCLADRSSERKNCCMYRCVQEALDLVILNFPLTMTNYNLRKTW